MNKLQKALRLNAWFSGISGLMLIALNQQIANLFETTNTTVFWVTGIALLLFAGTIIYETKNRGPIAVLWIIVQDFLWVIGSIVLIAFDPFEISNAGITTIAAIAFIVLLMGTTKIIMLFDFQYKLNYQNWLIHPFLISRFSKTAEVLLDNWLLRIEKLGRQLK